MNYHLKSKPRRSGLRRFITALVIVFVIVGVLLPGFFFTIGAFSLHGVYGIKNTIVSGYTAVSSYLSSNKELVRKNLELSKIANEVSGYRAQNEVLEEEVKRLRNLELPSERIISYVIATPPQAPFGVLIIANADEATVGDNVVSPSGVIIGSIGETSSGYAKVDLFSRGGNTLAVENLRTGERYEITGRSLGNYVISLPKDSDIKEGDVLIVREDRIYVVATVENLITRESSPFLTVYAKVPISISSLSDVVIKKKIYNAEQ